MKRAIFAAGIIAAAIIAGTVARQLNTASSSPSPQEPTPTATPIWWNWNFDVNRNGVINASDSTLVLQCYYGILYPGCAAMVTVTPTAVPTSTPTATSTATSTATPTPDYLAVIIADNTGVSDGCVTGTAGWDDWPQHAVQRTWNPLGTHLASWAMIQWDCNSDFGPAAQIEVSNYRLYGLLSPGWALIINTIYGSQINDPCSCNGVIYGSAGSGPIFDSPPHGRSIQFYQPFTPIPAGITAVYATYRARLTAPSAAFLMLDTGADWAILSPSFLDYGDMGVSRLKRVTTEWQAFSMTTLTPAQLTANPPPP